MDRFARACPLFVCALSCWQDGYLPPSSSPGLLPLPLGPFLFLPSDPSLWIWGIIEGSLSIPCLPFIFGSRTGYPQDHKNKKIVAITSNDYCRSNDCHASGLDY